MRISDERFENMLACFDPVNIPADMGREELRQRLETFVDLVALVMRSLPFLIAHIVWLMPASPNRGSIYCGACGIRISMIRPSSRLTYLARACFNGLSRKVADVSEDIRSRIESMLKAGGCCEKEHTENALC